MKQDWIDKATLYEMLSLSFLYTSTETIEALISGEFTEALLEVADSCSLDPDIVKRASSMLETYEQTDGETLLHTIRTEYTRMFIGSPRAVVSPYAGIWYAQEKGLDPMVFVNKESMAVERFMLGCGLKRPDRTNEPLDHIGTELEFLNYLCLVRAGVLEVSFDDGRILTAYEDFYESHFATWAKDFAGAVIEETDEPLFKAAAQVLTLLPDTAW